MSKGIYSHKTTDRGFEVIEFADRYDQPCKIQQSSAIDTDKPSAIGNPGTSCLHIGTCERSMHLGYADVERLAKYLNNWLAWGSFYRPADLLADNEGDRE